VLQSVADLVEELNTGKPSSRLDSPVYTRAPVPARFGQRHQTDLEHLTRPRPQAIYEFRRSSSATPAS